MLVKDNFRLFNTMTDMGMNQPLGLCKVMQALYIDHLAVIIVSYFVCSSSYTMGSLIWKVLIYTQYMHVQILPVLVVFLSAIWLNLCCFGQICNTF